MTIEQLQTIIKDGLRDGSLSPDGQVVFQDLLEEANPLPIAASANIDGNLQFGVYHHGI